VGHKGVHGHEFLEFEFKADGRLRYANNSNYKSDVLIRREGKPINTILFSVFLNDCVIQELKRIIEDSEIMKYLNLIVCRLIGKMIRTGLLLTR